MYFRARMYDPALGTFVSPDTLVPEPGRVVDYNRFAFVRGNPLRYSDPTGHFSEEQLAKWYGDNWRDLFSQDWIDILLDTKGSENLGAQLGDLLVMGGRQYVFAVDGNQNLALWDVQLKAGYEFAAWSVGNNTTSVIGLYRRLGDETGSARRFFSNKSLGATNGASQSQYSMQKVAGDGPRTTSLDGDWWMGNGNGQFVHSQASFSGWNWGETWVGSLANITFTGLSGVGGVHSAYGFYQAGVSGAEGIALAGPAVFGVAGLGGALFTTYQAAEFRSEYHIMSCSDLASFCK